MVSDMKYKISILERESETDEEYGDGMKETAGMAADTRVWHELTLTRKGFELQHPPLISRGSLILFWMAFAKIWILKTLYSPITDTAD